MAALLQITHDVVNIMDEAKQLNDPVLLKEATDAEEKVIRMAEQKEEQQSTLARRMDRLARRLGG